MNHALEEGCNAVGRIFRQFGGSQKDDKRVQSRVRDKEQDQPANCLDKASDPFAPNAEQEEHVLDLALDTDGCVTRHGFSDSGRMRESLPRLWWVQRRRTKIQRTLAP